MSGRYAVRKGLSCKVFGLISSSLAGVLCLAGMLYQRFGLVRVPSSLAVVLCLAGMLYQRGVSCSVFGQVPSSLAGVLCLAGMLYQRQYHVQYLDLYLLPKQVPFVWQV